MAVEKSPPGGTKMKCSDIKNLLSGYLDGDLGEKENILVSEHLKICSNCSKELDLLKETVSLLKAREPVEPPADFVVQVRKKIEARRWWKEAIKIIFYPWHIKIPAEAIATVLIACLVYYIYHQEIQQMPIKLEKPIMTEEGIYEVGETQKALGEKAGEAQKQYVAEEEKEIKILKFDHYKEEAKKLYQRQREILKTAKTREKVVSYARSPEILDKDIGKKYEYLQRTVPAVSKKIYELSDRLVKSKEEQPITLGAEVELVKPEPIELSVTLINPKKDFLKIRKYISLLNGKITEEVFNEEKREQIIILHIDKNNYLVLIKKLIVIGDVEPLEIKKPTEEDIIVKLKIK